MPTSAAEASARARALLASTLPRRWAHVQGVARQAEHTADRLGFCDDALVAAAWLHDIGYAPGVKDTGFHPLDGARYLRRHAVDEQIVRLVAHHSYALIEAAERGLGEPLVTEFPAADPVLADALCHADMTTSPDGEPVEADDRLAEIQARYGPGDAVTRFIDLARPDILAAVARTASRAAFPGMGHRAPPGHGPPCSSLAWATGRFVSWPVRGLAGGSSAAALPGLLRKGRA